eukprot:scaffold525045_cov126-Attheya_sp.AAC.1
MDAIWMSIAEICSSYVRVGTAASKCMVGGCNVVELELESLVATWVSWVVTGCQTNQSES